MNIPANTTTVTREDFERSGARTLEEALRAVPGLQIGTQGNAYPHVAVRGFRDTKDLAVLIDGIPFRQVGGGADLTMLPLNIVERIEFVKGPGSAIWGRGAVGGVLNIITTPNDLSKKSIDMMASFGSFQTYEGGLRGFLPYKNGYAMVNLGGGSTEGFQTETDKQKMNSLLQVNHNFSEMVTLTGQYLHSYVDAQRGSITPLLNGQPAYGVQIEDNYAIPGSKFRGSYDSLSLTPTVKLSSDVTLKNSLTFADYDRLATGGITILTKPSNKGWWQTDSQDQHVSNDLNLTWDKRFETIRNTMLAGTYFEQGSLDAVSPSYSGAPTYSPSTGWVVPSNNNPATGKITGQTINETDEQILSFYLQDRIEIGDVGLQAGVRYDHFDNNLSRNNITFDASQTDNRLSPRFGADWRFLNSKETELMVFASYAEGFQHQTPSFNTSFGKTVAVLLDPEVTKTSETGLKWTALDGNLFGQISVFHTDKIGPRSFRTAADDFLFTNAKTRVDGVETEIHYTVTSEFDVFAHYAYQDARHISFIDSSENDFSGNRMRMAPYHMAGVGANLRWGDLNWNMTANYIGERNLRDNNTTTPVQNLDDYTVVNTAVTYHLERYSIQFVVNNIFDEYYIADDFSSQDAGCPGDPRSFALIIRASF